MVEKTRDDLIRERDASLRLTRGLLDAMTGGVVYVGVDGSIQMANGRALELLGFSYDEITQRITQSWEPDTFFEDGSPCTVEDYLVTRALVTGEPQPSMTIGVRRPTGEIVWCVFTAQPLRDDEGVLTGAVVAFVDITERKRLEDARHESAATLESVVRNAPSIILKTDLEGRILFINRLSPRLDTELTPAELVGQSIYAFVNARDHARVRAHVAEVTRTGRPVAYELAGLDEADPSWYATRIGPVLRDDAVVELLMVVTDITDRKHAEQEHEALRAQLDASQRLEAVGRLAGGIAHDFNNLLTVILGHVNMLESRSSGGSMDSSLRSISDATVRAARMTRQLLAFSRHQELDPQHVEINHVINGVHEMLSRLLGDDIELALELGDGVGVAFVDQVQLERVVVNLATNGRDAMPSGGRLVIRTRSAVLGQKGDRAGGAFVMIDVIDRGTGVKPETERRMFEPFFTTKERGVGTGLGLATVHGIVKQSGGDVEVETGEGGTRVTVMLPRVEMTKLPRRGDEVVPDKKVGGERILLVEDAGAVRRITKQILIDAGYDVCDLASGVMVAQDGVVAIEDYDVLLTDVIMPKMSGLELASFVMERTPGIKVLFMSGYSDESIADRGLRMEDVGFLAKPFTADGLLQAIRGVLDR